MGEASQIPRPLAEHLLAEIQRTHLPYFFTHEFPANRECFHEAPCPCALGNIYQVLQAAGLEVDQILPWARSWFLRYELPDGGLNCDEGAYTCGETHVSSMVGTLAPLEAILGALRGWTPEEIRFLDRGAQLLLKRELRIGSPSQFNAEEREDEADWLKLSFPRFYFYDVLRGLTFVLRWAEMRQQAISAASIQWVVRHLEYSAAETGGLCVERHAFAKIGTKQPNATGQWERGHPETYFPLLEEVSQLGRHSPYLTAQWTDARARLERLRLAGLVR